MAESFSCDCRVFQLFGVFNPASFRGTDVTLERRGVGKELGETLNNSPWHQQPWRLPSPFLIHQDNTCFCHWDFCGVSHSGHDVAFESGLLEAVQANWK